MRVWRDWPRTPARAWRGWPVLVTVGVISGGLATLGGTASLITGQVDGYPRGGRLAAFGLLVYGIVVLLGGLSIWLRPTRAFPGRPLVRDALALMVLLIPAGRIDSWMNSPRPRWPIPLWELLLLGWLLWSLWKQGPQESARAGTLHGHDSSPVR